MPGCRTGRSLCLWEYGVHTCSSRRMQRLFVLLDPEKCTCREEEDRGMSVLWRQLTNGKRKHKSRMMYSSWEAGTPARSRCKERRGLTQDDDLKVELDREEPQAGICDQDKKSLTMVGFAMDCRQLCCVGYLTIVTQSESRLMMVIKRAETGLCPAQRLFDKGKT